MDLSEKFGSIELAKSCSEKAKQKADAIVLKILQLLKNENLNVYDADRILRGASLEVMRSIRAMEHTTMVSVPESIDDRLWAIFTSHDFD